MTQQLPLEAAPLLARFEKHIYRNPETGCWEWRAALRNGYGVINVNGKMRGAHRVLYETVHGPIPKGLEPDHACRTRSCVRPEPGHIEIVTHAENIRRGVEARGGRAYLGLACDERHREIMRRYGARKRQAALT